LAGIAPHCTELDVFAQITFDPDNIDSATSCPTNCSSIRFSA
jgi:hypothetical protein